MCNLEAIRRCVGENALTLVFFASFALGLFGAIVAVAITPHKSATVEIVK